MTRQSSNSQRQFKVISGNVLVFTTNPIDRKASRNLFDKLTEFSYGGKAAHNQQFVKDKELERELRKQYANEVLKYLWTYSKFVAVVIFVNGFCTPYWNIDNYVVVVLAGSTAVAAIGLVGFVVQGLFRSK